MKFAILIAILMTTSVWGQKTLSRPVFQASVRPVLNGILSDFYQMISLFPDFPKEIIGVVNQMENLEEYRETFKANCPRQLNEKCQEAVDSLRAKLSAIEAHTLELTGRMRPGAAPYLNTIIGMRLITDFQNELYAFKGSLDNSSFLIRARIQEKRSTYRVIKKLDELQTMLSLAIVEFIPFQYKDDFRHFYFNFVHPVEIHIARNSNFEFLNRNVNSLNFAINLLNMNLTKRNKKTPEGMGPFLALIHNRWNSLLRYYF